MSYWRVLERFFGTYKPNVLTWLGLLILCMILYLCSYSDFFLNLTFFIIGSHIVFISVLGLLNRSLQHNICVDSLRCLIRQCSFLSSISTSSHKGRWFLFSFHIWSAIPDFSISPCTTAFWCSSSLTFSGRPVLLFYILPQLEGMEYTLFLIILNSVGGLTQKRYLWRAEPLVTNIRQHIHGILGRNGIRSAYAKLNWSK